MKKKIIAAVILVCAVGFGGVYYYRNVYLNDKNKETSDEGKVYMDSVASISGDSSVGMVQRFIGVVDPQESKDIRLDADKTLKEVYVEEGETVKIGDPLFSYDVDEMEQKIKEAQLELEELNNSLQTSNLQLAELQNQLAKAKEADKQAYTLEILSTQNSINKQQYSISMKELEIGQLQKSTMNAVVSSEMEGIVKKINKSNSGDDGGDSSSGVFMTILATGDYRIKGTCNEMNVYNLHVGEEMIIRPRSDDSRVYTGVVDRVDTEAASDTGVNNYGMPSDSGNTSSKYHFYVSLNEEMDMMLGQHVVMEPDMGQAKVREGLWIPSYYLVESDDGSYVWTSDAQGKTVKAAVSIGERDEAAMECQILSGLTEDDYIAFPDDMIEEGMEAVLPKTV